MRYKVFIFLYTIISSHFYNGIAQDIPIGGWRQHADFSNAKIIQETNRKLFCSTDQGLFYYDLEDNSVTTLSSVDGLAGVEPTALTSDPASNELIVGYRNGAIDFISEDLTLTSFLNIENSTIFSDKQINGFTINNDVLYTATEFGVILLSLADKQIIDTYERLGFDGSNLAINHVYYKNDYLYLSTKEGLLKGRVNSSVNLKDFTKWDRLIISDSTTVLESIIFNDILYSVTTDHAIYQLAGDNTWTKLFQSSDAITSLFADQNKLQCSVGSQIFELRNNQFESEVSLNQAGTIHDFKKIDGQLFIAHSLQSLALTTGNDISQSYKPAGPQGKAKKIIQIEDFTIFLPKEKAGFSYFQNGRWKTVSQTTEGNLLPSFDDVNLDLTTGNAIFLSAMEGLYSWDTREISRLSLSSTETIASWTSLAVSPDGHVWALVKTADNIALFNSKSSELFQSNIRLSALISDYLIAPNGDHYLATNNGLIAINVEESQERTLINSIGNGNLPSTKITALSTDLSGNLWIGTQNGLCYLSNFSDVFSGGPVNAVIPIFEGFFLFQGITINSIASDGGNRLWVGNRDGLWLFDESIQQNIMRITSRNSPLRTNRIKQHVINPINGEVFILNEDQLLSYRSASSRAKENLDLVKIFPNPVSLARDNNVSIDGLTNNMEVMITDLAGNVMYKNAANGGTFSWNLSNYSGFMVKPGIYLLFSVNDFGDRSYKGKFVVTK
ncbi:MAG: ligand-binding sensor domain-containing protein [Marivirga sp.]|jgi:ligand-binding sensor domain-containing protein